MDIYSTDNDQKISDLIAKTDYLVKAMAAYAGAFYDLLACLSKANNGPLDPQDEATVIESLEKALDDALKELD